MIDFVTFARLHGVDIGRLEVSSRIQRCGTVEHPKSKSGAFLYEGDRGWVQAWDSSGDGEIHWWDDPDRPEPTQAQRDEWERRRKQRELEQEQLWGKTARKTQELLNSAKLGEHNYLHFKGLGDARGLVLPDGKLFIPMRNMVTEKLTGFQTIWWDDETREYIKKMEYGTRARGSAYLIGPKGLDEYCLCEGYATGLSIDRAMRQLNLRAGVLVCFNDSNLIEIAKHVGDTRAYVFADNDKSEAGESAAQATGLPYCMADTVGWDANDLHAKEGIMAVMKKIMQARQLKKETV